MRAKMKLVGYESSMIVCLHACDCSYASVCVATNGKIPKFNSPIYLENKNQIGKIDEVRCKIKHEYEYM